MMTMVPQHLRKRLRTPVWRTLAVAAAPTGSLRVLPDFLLVGAQRAGTTTLMRALVAHPNITGPRLMKGVHYFDTAYHQSDRWYRGHFPSAAYAAWVRRRTGAPLLTGEACPYYLFHPLVPVRAARLLPDAKIVVLLRNPIERAISHYRHNVDRGFEPLGLEDALAAEIDRLAGSDDVLSLSPAANSFNHQNFSYVARGEYVTQLRRWLEHFDRTQLLVLQSELFFATPATVFTRVLSFLGAPSWSPAQFGKINPSTETSVPSNVRTRLAEHFAPHNAALFELIGEQFAWT